MLQRLAPSALTFEEFSELPADRSTTSGEVSDVRFSIRMSSNQLDTDGDPISNDVPYQVFSINEEERVLSGASKRFTLTEVGPLSGKYSGTWDDNIYTAFGISASISGTEDSYSGPFYYSNSQPNFTPCCGGSDDGNISFKISGNTLSEFAYAQNLPNFMGGCPGSYSGSGSIEDGITLVIDFTGNDCEGPHTGGKIRLDRIE